MASTLIISALFVSVSYLVIFGTAMAGLRFWNREIRAAGYTPRSFLASLSSEEGTLAVIPWLIGVFGLFASCGVHYFVMGLRAAFEGTAYETGLFAAQAIALTVDALFAVPTAALGVYLYRRGAIKDALGVAWRSIRLDRAVERADNRAAEHERMAALAPITYYEVAAPWREEGWQVTCSLGGGLAAFGLKPREVEGEDVRGFLREEEIERFERLFRGEAAHDEYEKKLRPEEVLGEAAMIDSRWQMFMRTYLDPIPDEDGRVCGVAVVGIPISEVVREQIETDIRTDLLRTSVTTLGDFFAKGGGVK